MGCGGAPCGKAGPGRGERNGSPDSRVEHRKHEPERILARPLLEARKLYDEAFRLNPNLVLALVSRAYVSLDIARTDPPADREGLLREADQLTRHAVALDGDDPGVWNARGWVLAFQRRWEESLTAYRESLRIAPNRGPSIHNMALGLL